MGSALLMTNPKSISRPQRSNRGARGVLITGQGYMVDSLAWQFNLNGRAANEEDVTVTLAGL